MEQNRASLVLPRDPQLARPTLENYEIVVNLIGSTTTESGLTVHAQLDAATYEKGRKVTDEEFEAVHLTLSRFHGEWNYVIRPNE